jgi:hypothetical protein
MKLVNHDSVRFDSAEAVSDGPMPPWRLAPWQAAQLAAYWAAASMLVAGAVVTGVGLGATGAATVATVPFSHWAMAVTCDWARLVPLLWFETKVTNQVSARFERAELVSDGPTPPWRPAP